MRRNEDVPCNCEHCGGRMTGLAHIGIHVKDMDRSKAYYLDQLGMELFEEANNNGTKLALIGVGSLVLELIERPDGAREAGVVHHVAIAVEDIETLVCKLIEKGVVFDAGEVTTMPQLFGGIKNIFFKGPDGEILEFFEHIKA